MTIAIVTGSAGLIGSETVRMFSENGLVVIGLDNDLRKEFFGKDASTDWNRQKLEDSVPGYTHHSIDIRDTDALDKVFSKYGSDISVIVHTAAQPSHDWAAKAPFVDFSVNANGTLNLLEMTRTHCPNSVFIFTSTNKVYGDTPNTLPLVELENRWELDETHSYFAAGIDENMSIDQCTHSIFGASKTSADLMVQEYGRYFGMKTACLRSGCLTGPAHSGAELHGFLAYLVKCAVKGTRYTVFGYKGKQVRDNIHSHDFVLALWHIFCDPRVGEVYNIGGSRHSNCSMLEAISITEEVSGKKLDWTYSDENRIGDHIWWISDVSKFQAHYPKWQYHYGVQEIISEINQNLNC